ncbi:MAG TPA: hypothetical protein VH325_03375 [Bryobacteraceae bacterium]|jgi:hypothetical protein|nr:hypothetical protein [Bryobacteraceae bacterium]
MILSKKYSVALADLFCDESRSEAGADIVRYNYFSTETAGTRMAPFHTIWINLTRSADDLLAAIHRDTRKEIRRAERDNAIAEIFRSPGPELIHEFCEAFNRSVAVKGLPPIDNSDLAHLSNSGSLLLSRVCQQYGPVLAWHVYYQGNRRCILCYSVSMHRATEGVNGQAIGRGNRYLHWHDLLYFQKNGFEVMDMGGWYGGSDDSELLLVNRFKEEFGGKVMDSYNSLHALTMKGRGALKLLELKRLFRNS